MTIAQASPLIAAIIYGAGFIVAYLIVDHILDRHHKDGRD